MYRSFLFSLMLLQRYSVVYIICTPNTDVGGIEIILEAPVYAVMFCASGATGHTECLFTLLSRAHETDLTGLTDTHGQ